MQIERRRQQRDVLVGEVEHFDIADGIRAVGRQAAGMGHGDGAVRIEGNVVFVPVTGEHSPSTSAIPSLSVSSLLFLIVRTMPSWPGLIVPVNMLAASVVMLIVQGDRRAGMLGIAGGEDADLDVEPLVAVDDVVAGIAR